jgi:hypothetical protein
LNVYIICYYLRHKFQIDDTKRLDLTNNQKLAKLAISFLGLEYIDMVSQYTNFESWGIFGKLSN